MPKQPFLSIPSGDVFAPVFSGFAQTNLAPSLGFIREGSGYRALTAADFAAATITGTVSGNFTNNVRQVAITGANGVALDTVTVSGYNALPVFLASGSISSTTSNPVTMVGITGSNGVSVDVVVVSGFNAHPVFLASGSISSTTSNPVLQVGVTGANGLSVQVVAVSGYNAVPVAIASGSISAVISNNVTQVGITGANGTAASIQTVSGFNAIPVFLASGSFGSAGGGTSTNVQGVSGSGVSGNMPNPVLGGAWVNPSTSGTVPVDTLQATQMDTQGNIYVSLGTSLISTADSISSVQSGNWQVGITGATGNALNIVLVSGYHSIPVFIASGSVTSAGGNTNIQGVSGSGVAGNMPNPVLAGAWVNPSTSGVLAVDTLQALQLDNQGNLYVSLGTSLIATADSVSAVQSGKWQVGITGATGNALNIVLVSGYHSIPVFIASGSVTSAGGNTNIQGVSGSGVTGNMPNPVLGGAWVNPISSGIALPGNTLQAVQMDTSGNIWVSLGTSLDNAIDSVAVVPKSPLVNTAYQLTLTGVGVFNNYASLVPNLSGSLSMSVEPHSSNSEPIYYSFSGGAVTGQAWELRGDRTFELSATTGIFFAQTAGSQIVCFHVQTY